MKVLRPFYCILLIGVSMSIITSCQNEFYNDSSERQDSVLHKPEQKEIVISAYSADEDRQTKTSYESDSKHILWSPGDQISLFYGSGSGGGSCFTATNEDPIQRAQFSGSIDIITGITEETEEYSYIGVYPYSIYNSSDGSNITTIVPHEQIGKAETFEDGAFISIGKSAGLVMGFYNLCGAFYVKVLRDDIIKITLRGNNNEILAGQVNVSMATGIPIVSNHIDTETEISLTMPNGSAFAPNVGYFLICLPTRFTKGFYIEMETSGGLIGRKQFNFDFTLNRNCFQPFNETIDSDVIFINKVQQNNEIRYTTNDETVINPPTAWSHLDPSDSDFDVEATLVSNVYVNGVGIITYSANIVCAGYSDGINKDNLETISFPMSLQKVYYFNGCPNLRKVSFLGELDGQVDIGNPFTYCPNLEIFEGPNALLYYDEWSFIVEDKTIISFAPKGKTYCNIQAYNNISNIGANCFKGCNSLESIQLLDFNKIETAAFEACQNLEYVYLGQPLTQIGDDAFDDCISMSHLTLPNSLTTIGQGAFSGCSSLTNVDLPLGLRRIKAAAFRGTGLTSISIPSTIEVLGDYCFNDCDYMELVTVCAVTPPGFVTWDNEAVDSATPFFGTYPIYVPQNALNSYQNSTGWSKYSSRLQAITTN